MLYVLVDPENNIDRVEGNIRPTVNTKPGWRWLPLEEIQADPYNPETHVIEGPKYNVLESYVERFYTVREKFEYEIEAEKTHRLNNVDDVVYIALLNIFNKVNSSNMSLNEYKVYLRSLL